VNDSRDAIEWEIAITDIRDIDHLCLVAEARGSQAVSKLGNLAAASSAAETMQSRTKLRNAREDIRSDTISCFEEL
jgi:hypothetical protein